MFREYLDKKLAFRRFEVLAFIFYLISVYLMYLYKPSKTETEETPHERSEKVAE